MPDYLVKLYELPPLEPSLERVKAQGCVLRRAIPPEMSVVVDWVRQTFYPIWADECQVAFSHHPVSCFLITREQALLGFGCYESTCRGFFGPIGLCEEARRMGLGKALLLACLHAMRHEGYGYAIIGSGGGVEDFYRKTVGAIPIEGSHPGIYRGMLQRD